MEVQEIKEQLKSIFRQVINNDKWITIHPNGEDGKGRPLLLKDGESPKEAIERTYGKDKQSDTKDGVNWKNKDYTNVSDDELREKLYDITKRLDEKHGSFENAPYSEKEEYYFSVVGVISALTDSNIPKRYWTDLKRNLIKEGSQLHENIVQLKIKD